MNTRLKQFLAAENITQAQFADTINVVRASVSHILAGRNNPGYDFIRALMQHYPNLNIEWLVLGKGKMYKGSEGGELFAGHEEELPCEPTDLSDIPAGLPDVLPDGTAGVSAAAVEKTPDISPNPRKVSKIIVMFDDGTYQEM